MKTERCFTKRGEPDCPIAVACHANGRFLPNAPHWHPELEFAYVRQGSITCLLDDQPLRLSPGELLILSPGQGHQYLSPSGDAQVLFFIFSLDAVALPQPHIFQTEFVQPLKDGTLELPRKLDATHPAYARIAEVLDRPYLSFVSDPYYKVNRYHAAVNLCLALMPWCKRSEIARPARVSNSIPVDYTVQYIRNWYFKPLTLPWLANKVHLDPNYLSTLFHKKTGQTVTQYLTHVRIDAAVQLLCNSELSISQIIEQTGFQSESTFYQQFRKATGTTPRAFRRAEFSTRDGFWGKTKENRTKSP